MPQPILFEPTFISVGAISQERLAGAMVRKLCANLQTIGAAS
jgi:hypothetical protein